MKVEEFSSEEKAARKQGVFDAMSPRAQRWVLKKGYDKWDPFQEPKDPIDMRKDKTRRTSQVLIREFLQTLAVDSYSTQYARGAFETACDIVRC